MRRSENIERQHEEPTMNTIYQILAIDTSNGITRFVQSYHITQYVADERAQALNKTSRRETCYVVRAVRVLPLDR